MDIAQLGFAVDSSGLDKATKKLDNLNRAGGNTSKTGGVINKSMRTAAGGIDKAERSSASLVSGLGLIKGVLAGVGFATAAGSVLDYNTALGEVSTLVDTTSFDMDALGQAALDQARIYGGMPTDQVKGFYSAISAGATDVDTAAKAMTAANKLAVAGVTTTEVAVDGLTSVMNSYNGTAGTFEEISDVIFTTVKLGKTTVPEFAASIGALAPVAAGVGFSFEEVGAAVATLTAGGISTSKSMSGLTGVMSAIIAPSEKAKKLAEDLGISFEDVANGSVGFTEFLGQVKKETGGSAAQIATLFGAVEAITPIMALAGESNEKYMASLELMRQGLPATEEALNKMMATPAFQKNRIVSGLAAEFLELGNVMANASVPALRAVADSIGPMFDAVKTVAADIGAVFATIGGAFASLLETFNNSDAIPVQLLRDLAGAVGSVGDYLAPVLPYLGQFIAMAALVGGSVAGIMAVASALGAVGLAMLALGTNPLALTIAAVSALAVAAVAIYKNWDAVAAWWGDLWSGIQADAKAFFTWWNSDTSLKEKVATVASIGIEAARDVAASFFNWWNGSSYKKHAPQVVVDAVARAEELAASFFNWWDNNTLDEKITQVKTTALDLARTAAESFATWWAKPLDEKLLIVADTQIAAAKVVASAMFNWWDGSTLKKHTPQVAVDAIDKAREVGGSFVDWWDNTSTTEKVLDVKTTAIDAARTVGESFATWWAKPYEEKTASINTTPIDAAKRVAELFVQAWNTYDLKRFVPEIALDAFDAVMSAIDTLTTWWNKPLAEKSFDVGYAAVSKAIEIINKLKDLWNNLKLKALKLPSFLGGNEQVQEAKKLGANLSKGVGEGVTNAAKGVWTSFKGVVAGAIQAGKDEAQTRSPSVKTTKLGKDMGEGVVVGLNSMASVVGEAGRGLSESALAAFGDIVAGTQETIIELDEGAEALRRYQLKQQGITDVAADFVIATEAKATALQNERDIADDVAQTMSDMAIESNLLTIELYEGADAAYAHALEVDGFTESEANAVVELDKVNQELATQIDLQASAKQHVADLANAQYLQNIELTQGADAAEAARLKMSGLTDEQIQFAIETGNATEAQAKFHGALVSAITNADSIKGVFENLGEFIKDWLREKIAFFIANKITAFVSADTSGASGILSTLTGGGGGGGGILKTLGGLFSGGGGAGAAAATTSAVGVGSAGVGTGVGSLAAATAGVAPAATGASTALGGLTASLGTASAAIAPVAIAAGATVVALKGVAEYTGQSFNDVFKNFALGGDGGFTRSVLLGGDKWNADRQGFEAGYTGGEVVGNDVQTFKKRKSFFRGNDYKDELSELDAGISGQLNDYFGNMNDTIVAAAGSLGVAGADSILADFEVATQRFIGKDAEADLAEWLEASTLSAYQTAFDGLGPEVQGIVDGMVDIDTASAEEIGAVFAEIGATATAITPALRGVSLEFGNTGDETAAISIKLAEALGGTSEALSTLDLYAREFVPASVTAANTLAAQTEGLDSFNLGLSMVGREAITSREGMYNYIESLKDQHAAGELTESQLIAMTAAAMGQLEAVIALEDATLASAETLRTVGEAADLLNLNFDATGPLAEQMAGSLVELMGGLDSFNAATASYYNNFYSASEQQQAALQQSTADVFAFNQSLGLTGEAAINTEGEFRAYVESLDLQTEAGQQAFAAAMQVEGAMRMVADTAIAADAAMAELHAEQARQIEVLGSVRDVARDLNLNFDATSPSALNASNALVELMGGMDGFSSANQNYLNTFYSETERGQIALTNAAAEVHNFNSSLGLTGEAAIDTKDEFRAYIESLDLQTEAGREAYAAAMGVVDSMGQVVDSEKTVAQIMAEMPETMQNSFNEMTDTAAASAEEIAQTNFDIVNSQTEAALALREIIVTNVNEQTNAVSAGYLAQATSTADFIKRAEELQIQGHISEAQRMSLTADAMEAHQTDLINLATDGSAAQLIAIDEGNEMLVTSIVDAMAVRLGLEEEAQATALTQATTSSELLLAAADARYAADLAAAEEHKVATGEIDTLALAEAKARREASYSQAAEADAVAKLQQVQDTAAHVAQLKSMADADYAAAIAAAQKHQAETGQIDTAALAEARARKENAYSEIAAIETTAKAHSIQAASEMASGYGDAATKIVAAGGKATGNMGTLAGGIDRVGDAAIKSAEKSRSAIGIWQGQAAANLQNWYNNVNGGGNVTNIDGSHYTGLSRVPFDGYIAELHRNEMVVPADDAAWLRGENVSSRPIGTAATGRTAANDSSAGAFAGIERKLEAIRKDNAAAAMQNNQGLGGLANAQTMNNRAMNERNRIIERGRREAVR